VKYNSTLKFINSLFALFLIAIFSFSPIFTLAQKDIKIVETFEGDNITFENTIIISKDIIAFKNNEITVRLSKNNEILGIELHTLGIKWSGNTASFNEYYNEYCKIITESKYKTYSKSIQDNRIQLLNSNDVLIKNDSLVSYKEIFPEYSFTKTKTTTKILGNKTTLYKIEKGKNNIELFLGYKLSEEDFNTLKELNIILQKISTSFNRTYSISMNYLVDNGNLFPLKTSVFNSTGGLAYQEEVIVLEKTEIDKSKCHSNNNYASISLFDLLQAAKNEIKK
jgi:DNA-binding XRE family transcriptional regulator